MIDMRVRLGNLVLDNPVIPASGTFGFGKEFAQLYDINILGSLSFKGTTEKSRKGNPLPRVAEAPMGMINSVGLENPGLKEVVSRELPELKKVFKKKVVANISGFSIEEYAACAVAMDREEQVGIVEVNISCPNVKGGGLAFGQSPKQAAHVTKAVKSVTSKPVFIKLSPNVTDIGEVATACEEAGADGISLINTLQAMRIDIRKRKPVLANKIGGLSGPAVFPVALRMVNRVYHAVKIPIMGMGGVSSAEDVVEMIMAGATAVQIGAANLINPFICKEIVEELPGLMKELSIYRFDEIRGVV